MTLLSFKHKFTESASCRVMKELKRVIKRLWNSSFYCFFNRFYLYIQLCFASRSWLCILILFMCWSTPMSSPLVGSNLTSFSILWSCSFEVIPISWLVGWWSLFLRFSNMKLKRNTIWECLLGTEKAYKINLNKI